MAYRIKNLSTNALWLGLKKREASNHTFWNSLVCGFLTPESLSVWSIATKLLSRHCFWSLAARMTLSSKTVCSSLSPQRKFANINTDAKEDSESDFAKVLENLESEQSYNPSRVDDAEFNV